MITENVVPLPDALERLATKIKANLVRADKADAERIEALVAVAVDVAHARSAHKDDIGFGAWWDGQRFTLNGRLLNHIERAALVAMGRKPDVMHEVLAMTDRRSIEQIYHEHKNRFTEFHKPPRRKGEGKTRKEPSAPKREKVQDEVDRIVRAGQPVNRKEIAAKYGISEYGVQIAYARAKGRLEGEAKTAAVEPHIDPKTLSMTAQQRLEAVIKQERKRLEVENKEYLDKQIDFHIKRLKAECLPRWEEDARIARLSREQYQKLINNHKPPLTKAEYQLIRMTAHEDNSAGQETRKRAMIILNNKKFVLTGEQ